MKFRIAAVAVLLLPLTVLEKPSQAQRTVVTRTPNRSTWYRQPTRSRVYGGYGYGGYTSTPVEGARRGTADIIRSTGEAAESVSRAAINREQARSAYMDNKLKWTQTYWARKRLGEAELEKDYAKKRAAREAVRGMRVSTTPARLGPSQLDPVTGKINWPPALMGNDYAKTRAEIEELFVVRAHTSAHPDLASKIHGLSREMQSELKGNVRDVLPQQYIAARKFLDSLAEEGLHPAG